MIGAALGVILNASPVSAYIKEIKPKIQNKEANRIAAIIEKTAKKYNFNPLILAAILKQESNFRTNVVACWPHKLPSGCIVKTCDIGISQINWVSWGEKWHLNACRLRYDDAYNINIAGRILAIYKRLYGNIEDNWYLRYHDNRNKYKKEYEERIDPYLAIAGLETGPQ